MCLQPTAKSNLLEEAPAPLPRTVSPVIQWGKCTQFWREGFSETLVMAAVIVSPSFPVNLEFLSSFSTRAEENQWYRIPVAHRQHMPGRGRYDTYSVEIIPAKPGLCLWVSMNPPNSSVKPPVLPVQRIGWNSTSQVGSWTQKNSETSDPGVSPVFPVCLPWPFCLSLGSWLWQILFSST